MLVVCFSISFTVYFLMSRLNVNGLIILHSVAQLVCRLINKYLRVNAEIFD